MKYNFILLLSLGLMMTSCESGSQQNAETKSESTAEQQASAEERNKAKSIEDWKNEIKNNPEWLANVVKQAKDLNISLDSCLNFNSIYCYRQNHPEELPENKQRLLDKSYTVEQWQDRIKENKEWFAKIKLQSKELKITLDSCLKMNAEYCYKTTQLDN